MAFLSMNKRWLQMYNNYMLFIKNVDSRKKIQDLPDFFIEGTSIKDITYDNRFIDAKK